jgi:hypothetical protein
MHALLVAVAGMQGLKMAAGRAESDDGSHDNGDDVLTCGVGVGALVAYCLLLMKRASKVFNPIYEPRASITEFTVTFYGLSLKETR